MPVHVTEAAVHVGRAYECGEAMGGLLTVQVAVVKSLGVWSRLSGWDSHPEVVPAGGCQPVESQIRWLFQQWFAHRAPSTSPPYTSAGASQMLAYESNPT